MDTSHDNTNEVKAATYESLAVINRGFEQIISAIYKLQTLGVVSDEYVESQEIIASEMWAKINCNILTSVTEREQDDRNHFSRMRANLEKQKK
ncbi:MAG TPA: hypothetical protein VKL99_12790 [Candidatus Angelobacter sp.]|nr:hypothetical protein [Candidatus Angelobacter sp.]